MDDPLKVIHQADKERLENADIKASIKILKTLGKKIKDDPILSYDYPNILKKLGVCYLDLGKIEKAREYLEEALEVAERDFNKVEVAEIRISLARLEFETGTLKDALYYANKAWNFIDGKKGAKFIPTKANSAEMLGKIYYEKGEYKEALEKFKFGMVQTKKVKYPERRLTIALNFINHYITRGNIEEARKLMDEHMPLVEEQYALIYPHYQRALSRILLEEGEIEDANRIALKVLDFAEEKGLARLRAVSAQLVGSTYSEKDPAKADSYFKMAFDLYNKFSYNLPKEHPKEEDWFSNFDDID